jgi:sodium transport system permease protein
MTSGLRQALVVCRKEVVDSLRDRRSMLMAIMGPLLCVVGIGFIAAFVGRAILEATQLPLTLQVFGMERAPDLMTFLREHNVRVRAGEGTPEDLIRGGERVVLVVPESYGPSLRAGKPAPLRVVLDRSQISAAGTVNRLEGLLAGYSARLGALRLVARGVDHSIAQAVAVERVDLSTPQSRSSTVLNVVPLLLLLSLLLGGIGVATDSTAGERERGSLEPLLLNPVQRGAVVVGKWLTTVVLACVAIGVCLGAFLLAVNRVPLQDLGVKARFDAAAVLGMLATVVPLAFFASAGQMLVSTYARSFKEAQTYIQLLLLLPMIPGMVLALSPVQSQTWMFTIPVFSQQLLVGEVLRGQPVGVLPFVLGTLGSAAAAALCLALTTRLLAEERIIFGRS